jgi:hypothetical protein
VPGTTLPGQLGLCVAASPNAATMRPRTELSTDDNVKKQTRVNIVVRDRKHSACQGQASAVGVVVLRNPGILRWARCTRYSGFLGAPTCNK